MDNNKIYWNTFWENQFELICERGDAFFMQGYTLLAASEVLFRRTAKILSRLKDKSEGVVIIVPPGAKITQEGAMLSGNLPAHLLLALAMENFIKEYLCKVDHSLKLRTKIFPKGLRSHDLITLIKRCKIDLNSKEELLLKYLSSHLYWRGRYNIPLTSDQYIDFHSTTYSEIYVHTSFEKNGKFSPEVKSILRKLGVRYRGI